MASEPPPTTRYPTAAALQRAKERSKDSPREGRGSSAVMALGQEQHDSATRRSALVVARDTTTSPGRRDRPDPSPTSLRQDHAKSSPRQVEGEREVRVKGINFTTALEAVQQLYGATARNRVEKESPGALGSALRFGGIVAGGWYPIAWYRDFWAMLRDGLGADEIAARRIGHRAAGIGVNAAYRALARMSSPTLLLSMAARAFRYYYETPASLVVKHPEPKRLTAEWTHCAGFDRMIWSEVEGGATYFIEATGATGVVFSVIAGGGSNNHMLATATWR